MKTVTPLRLLVTLTVIGAVLVGLDLSRGGADDDAPSSAPTATASPSESSPATAEPSAAPVPYRQLRPRPQDARADRPDLYADGCQVGPDDYEPTRCAYGASAEDATATIAVIGDSKSGQWATALQELAETRGWRILIYTKSACAAVAVPVSRDGQEYRTCTRFNRRIDQIVRAEPVDLLLTSNSSDAGYVRDKLRPGDDPLQASRDYFVRGERKAWQGWIAAGNRVAVISDIPRPNADGETFDLPTCVEENRDDYDACAFDRAAGEALSARGGQLRAIEASGGLDVSAALRGEDVPGAADAPLVWIDPVPLFCSDDTCPPTSGRYLVYREGSHLTRTYVSSLSDQIGSVMTALGLP